MKCSFISERIADLFDGDLPQQEREQLMAHIESCIDCGSQYHEVLRLATAIAEHQPEAGKEFRERLLKKIGEEPKIKDVKQGTALRSFPWKTTIRIAASILLLFSVITVVVFMTTSHNPTQAAGKLIDRSLEAMLEMKSVQMSFRIRTGWKENFEYIDPAGGFQECRLWKTFGNPARWRIEKGGRIVIMDGKHQYLSIAGSGYVLKGGPGSGFVQWLKIFLDPAQLLESEKNFARDHNANYKIEEKNDKIILTVKAKALGDFQNAFALNSSVMESNNTRVYTFDKATLLPISLEVVIEDNLHQIPVIELNNIIYDHPVADSLLCFVPVRGIPVISFDDLDRINLNGIKNVSCEEAAHLMFEAFQKNDWPKLKRLYPLAGLDGGTLLKNIQKRYSGSQLLWLGKSFKSGLYPGDFIPYMIRLKEGDTIRGTLALRRDNPSHSWNIDGGI